jgi:hypothetical protein
VELVTSPNAHKTRSITAIVHSIKLIFQFVLVAAGRRLRTGPLQPIGLLVGHRRRDGHVVDHARDSVDVIDKLGNEAFLGGVFGNTT